jgi:hypothetical protein
MALDYEIRIFNYGEEVRRIGGLTKGSARAIFARESERQNQYTQLVVNGMPKVYHEAEKLLELNTETSRKQFKMKRWGRESFGNGRPY